MSVRRARKTPKIAFKHHGKYRELGPEHPTRWRCVSTFYIHILRFYNAVWAITHSNCGKNHVAQIFSTLNLHGIAPFIWLGLVWCRSDPIRSEKTKTQQWFHIKRLKGNFFCQILFWNDMAYFIHLRIIFFLFFFFSSSFLAFLSQCIAASRPFHSIVEDVLRSRTYIHRLRCWHSFEFFFYFFTRDFETFFRWLFGIFGAFFFSFSPSFWFFHLFCCAAHVFSIFFCLLWHLDTPYIIHPIM